MYARVVVVGGPGISIELMYGQLYELPPNASDPANYQQTISQNSHSVRHGLNGPAILLGPNEDEHMAHAHQHIAHGQQQQHQQQQQQQPVRQNSKNDKDRINVLAIPATTVVGTQVIIGDASSSPSFHFLVYLCSYFNFISFRTIIYSR